MPRIIINNESNLDDASALSLVLDVVKRGRESAYGTQYCFISLTGKHEIFAGRTKSGTDTFLIRNRCN